MNTAVNLFRFSIQGVPKLEVKYFNSGFPLKLIFKNLTYLTSTPQLGEICVEKWTNSLHFFIFKTIHIKCNFFYNKQILLYTLIRLIIFETYSFKTRHEIQCNT